MSKSHRPRRECSACRRDGWHCDTFSPCSRCLIHRRECDNRSIRTTVSRPATPSTETVEVHVTAQKPKSPSGFRLSSTSVDPGPAPALPYLGRTSSHQSEVPVQTDALDTESQQYEYLPLDIPSYAKLSQPPTGCHTWSVPRQLCLPEALSEIGASFQWLASGGCKVENVTLETIELLVRDTLRRQDLHQHCIPWTIQGDDDAFSVVIDESQIPARFSSCVERSMEKECAYILDHHLGVVAEDLGVWMQELASIGYTTQDLVQVYSDEYFATPWIRSQSSDPPDPFTEPERNLHRINCPHLQSTLDVLGNSGEPSKIFSSGLASASQSALYKNLLSRECVLAGLHDVMVIPGHEKVESLPSSREGYAWSSGEGIQAQVTYPENYAYMLERIESICGAVACLQAAGLCCNSWTIIVNVGRRVNEVDMHSIDVQAVLDLRQALRQTDTTAITVATREIFRQMLTFEKYTAEADGVIALMFRDRRAMDFFLRAATSATYTMHLVALATQCLGLSLVSFVCAHVGSLKLEFLVEGLELVTLLGCEPSMSKHIDMRLQRLTCLDGMVSRPIRVFSICRHDPAHSGIQYSRLQQQQLCDLTAKPEDLVDTFGENLISPTNTENHLCVAIRVGGGLIARSSDTTSSFHWSSGYHLDYSPRYFKRDQIITVGLLNVNPNCSCNARASRKQAHPHLRALGTCQPLWELNEKEVGFNAGQYFNLTGTVTFNRIPGISLKKVLLDNLWSALERPFGLQISVCTALARRVPLRVALADTLPYYVESSRPYPSHWYELRDVHKISEALRSSSFKTWYDDLPDEALRNSIDEILRKQTVALGNTGIHPSSGGDYLVVAWWSAESSDASIHLDLSHEANTWARLLKDSPETATFAYITESCLESRHHKCSKEAMLVTTGVTSMLSTELHEFPGPSLTPSPRERRSQIRSTCRLLPDTTYHIGLEGECLIAKVRSASQPSEPEIQVSQLNVPARIWRRIQGRKRMTRLVERGAYVDSDQGQEVHISSGPDTGEVASGYNYTHDPQSQPNTSLTSVSTTERSRNKFLGPTRYTAAKRSSPFATVPAEGSKIPNMSTSSGNSMSTAQRHTAA